MSNHGSGNIYLDRVVEGQYNQSIFATNAKFAAGETKRWLVGCYGDEYRLFINGNETLVQPTIDSEQQHARGTGFGLVSHHSQTGQRWDRFAVYPLIFALEPELSADVALVRAIVGSVQNYDTFTDANGTELTAHQPETGGQWIIDAGMWQIVDGMAVPSGDGDHYRAVVDSHEDVQASVQLVIPSEFPVVRAGLVVRRSDPKNYSTSAVLWMTRHSSITTKSKYGKLWTDARRSSASLTWGTISKQEQRQCSSRRSLETRSTFTSTACRS